MATLDTITIDDTTITNNDEITAKANSLRDQLRPFIEERSLKKLQKNSKMVELSNLKFKLAQKYLDLRNRTNITFNYLMNKVNNRSKFLDNKLQNSFAFKRNLTKIGFAGNSSLTPAISPALLQNNNTFKINSKIINAISKENLDNLETKLNENELLIKQINDYRSKLTQINEILEEMELVNQEVIIEEDQETVKKDELMNKLENEQNMKLEEINLKKEKIENDLNQCLELYKTLKMKLNAVLHQKNNLKAKVNEQKRLFADVSMKLKSLVENNRKEMNEFQRKIIERRERDLAIIKAFRIRKIELTKYLEEKESLVKKNLNLSENSFKTVGDLEKGDGEKNFNDENLNKNEIEDADDAAYIDYNLIEEFNPEVNVKNKYFKELSNNYRISRRDTVWKIKLGDATHLLNNEKRLEDVEGIVFVDEEFNYPTENKFEIGDGYFSTLYQGKSIMYKTNDKKLIIKKFNFNKIDSSIEKEILDNGFKVCAYLSKYPNKNIVEILDLYEIENEQTSKIDYYLVEEYCLSNLDQFLCDFKNELCLSDIKTIADGLANALFFLHNNGIAHQNICTLSIQINERKLIRLGYMECSVICYSPKENCFKTKTISEKQILDKRFTAPEVLGRSKYCPIKADIYSYGLILAYCYRRKPFNKLNDNQTMANRKEIEISELATSLIENCLIKNPNNRFSINNILTHCYFN